MRGFALSLAGIVAAGFVIALLPAPDHASPKIGTDNPTTSAFFRAAQRLDENGRIAPGAIMRAVRQREDLVRQQRGGVSPAVWQSVGPFNVGGRIRAIVIRPDDPNTIYIGSASGGIWKTTNGGTNWKQLDDFMPTLAVSALVMAPGNPDVIYAGTGEGFWESPDGELNSSALRGAGIWKTMDGGANWFQIPSTNTPDFYGMTRLAISPTNANVMLATCTTGVWRSADAGNTWTRTLATHAYDVDFHPTDGNRAVCGVHDDGVYTTTDAGLTWTHSVSIAGHRTELAYARSNPSIVYATVGELGSIRVWRSTNGGVTFTQQGGAAINTYEAYNNTIWVDPTNANNILYGGVYIYRSTNGGASRSQVFTGIHPDQHIFVEHPQFNGTTNKIVFNGGDGGIYRINDSSGSSATWITNGLNITQFYGASINPISGRILGGTQDNYTQLYSGNASGWTQTFGGDGGFTATDPTNQNYFYGTVYYALHFRSTNGGTSASYIYNTANPIQDANIESNVNFENYLYLDPNNPNTLFSCCQRLWRTTNAKATSPDWFSIKAPAPPNRGNRSGPGGTKDIPTDHFNPVNPINISTMVVAPGNSDLIWVGHNNGQLYKTTNGTATNPTWTRMDIGTPLPDRWVSRIVVSPFNANKVYVSFMGWTGANVWVTTDGGATWSDLATGRLPDAPVSAFAVHKTMPGWLYAGGDLGLFVSMDDGLTWTANNQGPAIVPIEELVWKDTNTLMAVTHGRGIWLATLNGAEDAFSPDSATLPIGNNFTGRFQDCLTSDDYRLDATPSYIGARSDAPIQFEFTGKSHYSTGTQMKFIAETQCDYNGMDVALALYNPNTNLWEEVLRQPATLTDSTVTATVPNPNRFISVTGIVKGRVRFYVPGSAPRVVHGRVDLAYWRLTP